jgi:hypothetical protein
MTSLRRPANRNAAKVPKRVLAIALLSTIGLSTGARAAVVDLGTFSSAVSLPFENRLPPGSFQDTYTFTIESGSTLVYTAFLSTGFMRNTGIADLEASLFENAQLVEAGVATTHFLPLVPFPIRDVEFALILLDAGDYSLVVGGTAFSVFPDVMAFYGGTLTLDTTPASVPEPGTLAIFGIGLAALAVFRRGQRQGEHP